MTKIFFIPLFCCCFWIRDPGSEIRNPRSGMGKNQDPGSGMNIPDPPHCFWLMDPNLDPATFVSDHQDVNKKFFAYSFLKVHFHNFSKIKGHAEVTKHKELMFSHYFCLMTEGSGSVYLTNGYGSEFRRPKNIWILRIRIRIRNTARNKKRFF